MVASYLIWGIVFPDNPFLEMIRRQKLPPAPGWAKRVINAFKDKSGFEETFQVVLSPNPVCNDGTLAGQLRDRHGVSHVFSVVLSRGKLRFSCREDQAGKYDTTHFLFKREGALWVGVYSGDKGSGKAKCFVTRVSDAFFRIKDPQPKKKRARR